MDPSIEFVFEEHCSSREPLTEPAQQELEALQDHGQTLLFELSDLEEKHSTVMQRKRKSISSLNSPKKNSGRIDVAWDLSCADTHFWWMEFSRRMAPLCHSWSTTVTLAQLPQAESLCFCLASARAGPQAAGRAALENRLQGYRTKMMGMAELRASLHKELHQPRAAVPGRARSLLAII